MKLKQLLTAVGCNTYRSRSAHGAWMIAAALLLPNCGKVADSRSRVDSESHFLGCSSDADCGGTPCSGGVCVDAEAPVTDLEQPPAAGALPPSSDEARCTVSVPGAPITEQGQINRFEGCENIYGDLKLTSNADLRPLHALRNLQGSLSIFPLKQPQASLEGLDQLEVVSGSLRLMRLQESSLAHLGSLRSVGTTPDDELFIAESELRDLRGLENLMGLHHLELSGLRIESIDALHLPSSMGTISLQSLPNLVSAEALRSVAALDILQLQFTGLTSLAMLSGTHVRSLLLDSNSALTDVGGLGTVDELGIRFAENVDSLVLPPRIAGLKKIAISENSALQSISGLEEVSALETVSVHNNYGLSRLSLPGLESLTTLEVVMNPDLTTLDLPQLRQPVESLIVVSNASLRSDTLSSVSALARKAKVGANQGDAIALDPCPFERDGYCDAISEKNPYPQTPYEGLCATGTDLVDCANRP